MARTQRPRRADPNPNPNLNPNPNPNPKPKPKPKPNPNPSPNPITFKELESHFLAGAEDDLGLRMLGVNGRH